MNGSVKFWIVSVTNKEDSSKKEKTSIRRYVKKYTEYSRSQITRLIKREKETSTLKYGKGKKRNRFKKSTPRKMLNFSAEADNAYRRMSGDAMRKVFEDEFKMYGKKRIQKFVKISHGPTSIVFALPTHTKREVSLTVERTISVSRSIGIRKKPQPNGKPGYIRADTVHQGDLDGVKGVYHVNLVDEVTQWEILICVDSITENRWHMFFTKRSNFSICHHRFSLR